jgi:hypothetical protein
MTVKEKVLWFANTRVGSLVLAIVVLAIVIGLNTYLVKGKVF